jgi:hypothetical protein
MVLDLEAPAWKARPAERARRVSRTDPQDESRDPPWGAPLSWCWRTTVAAFSSIFGSDFVEQMKAMGIKQVLSAPRSHRSAPASHAYYTSEPNAPGPAKGYARAAPHPTTGRRADHRDP